MQGPPVGVGEGSTNMGGGLTALPGCFRNAVRGIDGGNRPDDQGAHVGVERFAVEVPQATLDDLVERLARVRWPGELNGSGWEDGTSSSFLRELVEWWRTVFDWRPRRPPSTASPSFGPSWTG
jgi:Epoxide hydrolase N terminus